jgi:hypothetical protein
LRFSEKSSFIHPKRPTKSYPVAWNPSYSTQNRYFFPNLSISD